MSATDVIARAAKILDDGWVVFVAEDGYRSSRRKSGQEHVDALAAAGLRIVPDDRPATTEFCPTCEVSRPFDGDPEVPESVDCPDPWHAAAPTPDDDTRREVEALACKGFQWIGQSFEHCDGCGRPAWEHNFDERIKRGGSPFSGEWDYVPWPADVIGRWLDRGLIDADRGADMLSRAAAYLGGTDG